MTAQDEEKLRLKAAILEEWLLNAYEGVCSPALVRVELRPLLRKRLDDEIKKSFPS